MSILKFIKKVCVQTAVYWAAPVPDGYGGYTFDVPVEISCRWEEKYRLFRGTNGNELETKAEVMITEDVVLQGWLYLGSLSDLQSFEESDGTINPIGIPGAYEIVAFDKSPLFRSTDKFVRTVFLGFKNLNN